MDPLLKEMQGSGLGLSINGLPVGSNAHADDIRAITNSWDNLEALIQMVQRYTTRNGLKLNVEKCEILTAPVPKMLSGLERAAFQSEARSRCWAHG